MQKQEKLIDSQTLKACLEELEAKHGCLKSEFEELKKERGCLKTEYEKEEKQKQEKVKKEYELLKDEYLALQRTLENTRDQGGDQNKTQRDKTRLGQDQKKRNQRREDNK